MKTETTTCDGCGIKLGFRSTPGVELLITATVMRLSRRPHGIRSEKRDVCSVGCAEKVIDAAVNEFKALVSQELSEIPKGGPPREYPTT